MNTYIGIDLGTSSVKLLLINPDGKILNTAKREYPVYYPKSGYSEQNPEDWLNQTLDGLTELLDGFNREDVKGLSVGGQMHGLVALDSRDRVIRPAILWNSSSTTLKRDLGLSKQLKDVATRKRWLGCTLGT